MDLEQLIEQLNEELGENTITTASNINRPEPKPQVKEIEMFNDFNTRNPLAGGGMLVQPSADGSRPGYKDDNLPDFITKQDSGYRVRSKKTKSNPAVSKNFKTLKEAKAFVREKNLVKSKTGVEYPELLEKAQSVVKDYNEIVDSAVTNNDLRNVKFFETYVKDRFKKKSEQDQILRQVYKKKIDYRDLTEIRKSVAKNLITEVMQMETIVPQQYIYNLLGADASRKLSSDVQQIVAKGLKNQTKIKVDNAINAIVEADEIIDDSLMKTVADRIGRTQFGNQADSAWKKAFRNNSYYKKYKELLDYAFTAGAKSTRAPGMSLSEILDDAKYKKGGGVTFSGKQTQFSGLKRYILDYARSHWHRNNFDGNPEKSLIEFYDKKGDPITWKPGLKLKLSEVQFKIPSESNIMWSYGGGPKGSVSVTGPIADSSGVFKEVTETYNVMKEISDAPVTNPVTGKETTYNDLVSKIYKDGYGYQGQNIFGLDQDHFKGVKLHPFKNLRAMDRRLNISLGAIDRTFDNRNLKAKLKKEMLGKLASTKGNAYNTALKNYFVDQATQVLDKGATPTLGTKSPYYSAVKNVYEQKDLPKVQKKLLEKSYQRAIKLEESLSDFFCDRARKAEGGRLGFANGTCPIAEKKKNLINYSKRVVAGDVPPETAQRIAKEVAKVTTKAGSKGALATILGPAGIGLDVVYEVGSIGADVLSGTPLKRALENNWITGAFTKTTAEEAYNKDLFKKFPEAQTFGRAGEIINRMIKIENTIGTIENDPASEFNTPERLQALQNEYNNLEKELDVVGRKEVVSEGPAGQFSYETYKALEPGSNEQIAYNRAKQEFDSIEAAKAPLKQKSQFGIKEMFKDAPKRPYLGYGKEILEMVPGVTAFTKKEMDDTLKNIGEEYGYGFTPYGLGLGTIKTGPQTGKYSETLGYQELADKIQKSIDEQRTGDKARAGGVAYLSSGGIASGPQRTSMNPDSGGLKGILKRAMKLKE